ncbi:biopolymer transporter ExbB [Pseudoprimorskyibacter insulae]|uniref:MotA/TolQ/ExbB proton channel domain-containing protein n=1 Tax=Pseudoprimorskyibacter insulae TaxID=1695997 RepID=A0A2R8ANB4_9RHOB|nr:biopolymer transporter ExbB [Pseudoprimorskyibacter insulae]SPF77541.1 hypothetical protein PRI8871_00124 [Pseudoprimorskyibacter insulae]
MGQPQLEAEPHFSQPMTSQVLLMVLVLAFTCVGAVFALPSVLPVFESNPYLNGFIFVVFVIGVISCFWQVFQLIKSVSWIKTFVHGTEGAVSTTPPQLLAPLATLLRQRDRRMQITTTSTRSILDSVASRIDEAREITRYIVNLLIFLGLLGTFFGLATTVPALVDTIRGLAPQDGETGVEVFARLMDGLENQLSGMGVAFGSSLLGLAGSLVVGLLELLAGHGQNRFYRELEEWLSTITRVSFSAGDGEAGPELGLAGYALDQMSEQFESLQAMFQQSEQSRADVDGRIGQLADSVERMTERLEASAPSSYALARIAEGQERLIDVLERRETGEGIDAESRMRLRSIDVQMLRILEELSAGRQESMAELRTDFSALTRAINQLSHGQGRPVRVTPRPANPTNERGD